MSRARTGTLVAPGSDGVWRARVTKDEPDGLTSRPLYSLGTTDETLARAKLRALAASVAVGEEPGDKRGHRHRVHRVGLRRGMVRDPP